MSHVRLLLIAGFLAAAVLPGCQSNRPNAAQAEQKGTQPNSQSAAKPEFQATYLTGREALQKMYIAARAWAPDA
ncbi:MAG: hypothetical protein ACXVZX_12025, partial [Terriglobales bacterium]